MSFETQNNVDEIDAAEKPVNEQIETVSPEELEVGEIEQETIIEIAEINEDLKEMASISDEKIAEVMQDPEKKESFFNKMKALAKMINSIEAIDIMAATAATSAIGGLLTTFGMVIASEATYFHGFQEGGDYSWAPTVSGIAFVVGGFALAGLHAISESKSDKKKAARPVTA